MPAESLNVSSPIVVTVTRGSATAANEEIVASVASSSLGEQPELIRPSVSSQKTLCMGEVVLQKPGTHLLLLVSSLSGT
jgi:hypothetical protein